MYHIPVFDRILSSSIAPERYVKLDERQLNIIYKALTLYGLGLIKAKPFNDMFFYKEVDAKGKEKIRQILDGSERVRIRYLVQTDVGILLSLRGFIYFLVQNELFKIPEEKNNLIYFIAKKFGLGRENLWILEFMNEYGILNEDYIELIHSFPPALTPKQAKKICEIEFKTLKPYIETYAYKKLRFICDSNNLQLEDMYSPLEYVVCHSCYNTVSQKRGKYLVNSLKQSIHNEVINTIMFYTSKGRQRLNSVGKSPNAPRDGGYLGRGTNTFYNMEFENIIKSVSISIEGTNDEDLLEFIGGEDNSGEIENRVCLYSLNQKVIDKYGKDSIQERIINVIENRNVGFVNWYNEINGTNLKSVSDVQETEEENFKFSDKGDKTAEGNFLQLLSTYFEINLPDFQAIIAEMKPYYTELIKEMK